MLATNLNGTINGSYYALREFKKSGRGTLINVASMAGKLPVAYYAAYSASKNAVVSLDAALRAELKADGQKGIKVCTVNPIASDTPFWQHAANYTGAEMNPRPLCKPDIVVKAISDLVENPKDEVNVGVIAHAVSAVHKLAPQFIESEYGKIVGKNQMRNSGAVSSGKLAGTPGILYSSGAESASSASVSTSVSPSVSTPVSAPVSTPVSAPVPARVIDLTHQLWSDIPNFHVQKDAFQYKPVFQIARDGFGDGTFTTPEHYGTHVDAPCHFVPGAISVDQISPEKLVLPAYVIDVSREAAADSDYVLTLEKVKEFERGGDIAPGAVVLLNTGWAGRWSDAPSYRNADARGTMHFPGFSAEACEYLVNIRAVNALGIDTLSLDPGNSTTYPVHRTALGKGIYLVENLDNLSRLPARGSTVFFGPLRIKGGTGSPARVMALVPQPQ